MNAVGVGGVAGRGMASEASREGAREVSFPRLFQISVEGGESV